ncbi:predicted protein, partial [Nematostella vectensis]
PSRTLPTPTPWVRLIAPCSSLPPAPYPLRVRLIAPCSSLPPPTPWIRLIAPCSSLPHATPS